MRKTCKICGEIVAFFPVFGWRHITMAEFDHQAKVI